MTWKAGLEPSACLAIFLDLLWLMASAILVCKARMEKKAQSTAPGKDDSTESEWKEIWSEVERIGGA
jgi:hypothetical protein